jgi:hypothetical protein
MQKYEKQKSARCSFQISKEKKKKNDRTLNSSKPGLGSIRLAWLTHSANKECCDREISIYLSNFNYYSLSFIHWSLQQHNLHQPISLYRDLCTVHCSVLYLLDLAKKTSHNEEILVDVD